MSRTVTLSLLLSRIRERAEVSSNYVSDTVLTDWINESIAELYGIITDISRDWYLCTTPQAVSVVSGTASYSLDSTAYKVVGVDVYSSGQWVAMPRFMFSQRNRHQTSGSTAESAAYLVRGGKLIITPTPTWSGSIRVWYVPTATKLSGAVDTFDGVIGWDEFVVADCCAKCAEKEESDPGPFIARKAAALALIRREATTADESEPDMVRDVSREGRDWPSYWTP